MKKEHGISQTAIEIETRFLVVNEDFLKDIGFDANSLPDFNTISKLATPEATGSTTSETFSVTIDDLIVSSILKAAQARKDSSMLTAPRFTVLESKEAQLAIQRAMPYVSGYSEPNNPSEKPTPKIDSIMLGSIFWVEPVLTDTENIKLDFTLEIRQLQGFEDHTYKGKYKHKVPTVDMASINTQCVIPIGKTMLIGGPKITKFLDNVPSGPKSDEPSAIEEFLNSYNIPKEEKMLLVLVKPTILSPGQAEKLGLDRPVPRTLGAPPLGGYGGYGDGVPPGQGGQSGSGYGGE